MSFEVCQISECGLEITNAPNGVSGLLKVCLLKLWHIDLFIRIVIFWLDDYFYKFWYIFKGMK